MSKVFLGVGHGGSDPGSSGFIIEKEGALDIAFSCKEYLENNGVEVKLSRTIDEDENLTDKINECNKFNPDLCADIHLNAGEGDGAEVFHSVINGKGKVLAENILKELEAIGQNSRGAKIRVDENGTDYFGFIRETKAPAVITEAFFVDNASDVEIGNTKEKRKIIGIAIAKGFLKTLNKEEIGSNTNEENNINNNEDKSNETKLEELGKISNIQKTLNTRYNLNIAVDNIYGSETKGALVKALQTELNSQYNKGLDVDGIFGKLTKNACVLVSKGSEGNITWTIQAMLVCKGYNLDVDGIFGENTENTVRDYQSKSGIIPDGIVGKETFEKLFN